MRHLATKHIEGSRTSAPRDDTPVPAASRAGAGPRLAAPAPEAAAPSEWPAPSRSPRRRRAHLTERRERSRDMAANINRVVLVGNLTQDPELRHTPGGTPVCSLRIAVNSRRQATSRATGSTSRTTSAFPSSATRPRAARSTSRRAAPSRSTAGSTGASGRRQDGGGKRESVEIVAESVQFLGSRGDGDGGGGGGGNQFVPAGAAPRGRRLPGRSRRRHPVLGEAWHARDKTQQRKRPGRARRGDQAAELLLLQGARSPRSTTRTSTSCGATSPRRGRSAAAASPARAAATRCRSRGGEAGARDGASPVRRRGRGRPERGGGSPRRPSSSTSSSSTKAGGASTSPNRPSASRVGGRRTARRDRHVR